MTPAILREICIRTARTGNTTAIVEFAKAHGAVVVVHDRPEAERVNRLGARAVSVGGGLMAVVGSTRGYVVDMPVLQRIATAWDADRDRADDATARAEGMEDHVAAWKARAEAAESDLRRYRNHLDDIRCAILDTGHPLGDDRDPELTPLRLVGEVLAKLAAPASAPVGDDPVSRVAAAAQAAIAGALGVAEALETPEALAKRLGLIFDGFAYRDQDGLWCVCCVPTQERSEWWAAGDPQPYLDALSALRAYERAKVQATITAGLEGRPAVDREEVFRRLGLTDNDSENASRTTLEEG